MNTAEEEIKRHATVVSERFLLRTITNTDGEELITDALEISVQSAVMSGQKDVNSSQFLLGQVLTISVDTP